MAPTLEEIKDIFGIDVNSNSENDEDTIYDKVKSSTEKSSFEKKNEELKEILKDAAIEEVAIEIPKVEEPKVETATTPTFEAVAIDFNEEQELAKELAKEEQNLVKTNEELKDLAKDIPSPAAKNEKEEMDGDISPIGNQIKLKDWNLISPSPSFDRFYQEKAKTLDWLMDDEDRKPIKVYKKELRSAAIDTSIPSYDGSIIMDRIREVQGWRDRVSQIQKECNYIRWEMAMDLLKGLLARVIYLKPAAKQPGVIYEHLGDMEAYYADLKETYHNAEIVNRNLTNAYESLSRQVTIVQPHPEKTVYEKKLPNLSEISSISLNEAPIKKKEEVPEQLKDFDELIDTKIEEVVKKEVNLEDAAKEVSWSELI